MITIAVIFGVGVTALAVYLQYEFNKINDDLDAFKQDLNGDNFYARKGGED